MSRYHLLLVIGYGVLSLVTFLFYGWDKWAAQRGKRRVRESSLQLLSLLGGWPGALLAQQMLRHKTQKIRFRLVFWLSLLANVLLVALAFFFFGAWAVL